MSEQSDLPSALSYPDHLFSFAVLANCQPQLGAIVIREDALPHAIGVELIGREVPVDKLDHLLRRHAGLGVSSILAEMVLLLLAPCVDILKILGVDVNEGIKEVRQGIVLAQLVVDEEQVLETVLLEGAARRVPAGLDLCRGEGAEADRPALEDYGLDGRLAGLVDGFPVGLWKSVALAGEGGLVVPGQFCRLVVYQGVEDAFG